MKKLILIVFSMQTLLIQSLTITEYKNLADQYNQAMQDKKYNEALTNLNEIAENYEKEITNRPYLENALIELGINPKDMGIQITALIKLALSMPRVRQKMAAEQLTRQQILDQLKQQVGSQGFYNPQRVPFANVFNI